MLKTVWFSVSVLLYPFLVLLALKWVGPSAVGGVVVILFGPSFIRKLQRDGFKLRDPLGVGLGIVVIMGIVSPLIAQAQGAKLAPVVINVVFGFSFARTLFGGAPPMIERFARMYEPELTLPKVRWCRVWTQLWVLYFFANAITITILAVWSPISWWVIYTGGINYVLMGVLFSIEFIGRWLRFGWTMERTKA